MSDNPEMITIGGTREEWQEVSNGLADILCWSRGFMAACDESEHHPMGVDTVRNLRERIVVALRDAARRAKG